MRRSLKEYRRNEEKVMNGLGFKPTKNSGAGWIDKEDGVSDHCICQLKSTDKKSLSVRLQDLQTLKNNADISSKIPVFALQFFETDDIWIMIRPDDLLDVQDIITERKERKKREDLHISVDENKEMCYNNSVMKDYKKNNDARERYRKKREEQESERKGRMKRK